MIDPLLLQHVDPDLQPILQGLDARLAVLEVAPVPPPPPPPPNNPPVWANIPPIIFTQGVPGFIDVSGYATDADGDPLTFTKNGITLPAGVMFDAAAKRFVYDGSGIPGSTSGHVLSADDGRA